MYLKNSMIKLLCTLLLLWVLIIFVLMDRNKQWNMIKANMTRKESDNNASEKINIWKAYKSILIYSTLFGSKYWPTLNAKEIKTFMAQCEYNACEITYDKQHISSSDAVLFHGVDVLALNAASLNVLRKISKSTEPNQKWVFLIQESPNNYNERFSRYKNLFDLVMSYKATSDLFVPYGHYNRLEIHDSPPTGNTNYARYKTNFGIWFVSNCGLPREKYMQELKKYIPLSVGGRCSQMVFKESTRCDRGSEKCRTFIRGRGVTRNGGIRDWAEFRSGIRDLARF